MLEVRGLSKSFGGFRAVAETVQHTEEGAGTVHVDRD